MEENIFASFSFTSPSKSGLRGTTKLKMCDATSGSRSASGARSPQSKGQVKRVKEETLDSDSKLLNDPAKVSSLGLLVEVEGKESDGKLLKQVRECVELETAQQSKHDGLINLKEEKEEKLCPLLSQGVKRNLSLNFGEDAYESTEDIEDCVSGSLKLSPMQLEKTATIVRKKRGIQDIRSLGRTAPPDWQQIVEGVRTMRIDRDAPVDLLGPGQVRLFILEATACLFMLIRLHPDCAVIFSTLYLHVHVSVSKQLLDPSKDTETQKFHILVAAMLSTQTRDAITAAAMKRLHAMPGGLTVQRVAGDDLSADALEQLLKPVGFYRQKAKHLKMIATSLVKSPYCGSVPSTLSELMRFPGVGPKVGLLVLWAAFGKGQEGFICDSNTNRVCSRLGWVPENSNPDETRRALEAWLPKGLWADLSYLFVGFGQQICKPVGPMCQKCEVSSFCPSAFKFASNKKSHKKNSESNKV